MDTNDTIPTPDTTQTVSSPSTPSVFEFVGHNDSTLPPEAEEKEDSISARFLSSPRPDVWPESLMHNS